MITFLVPCLLNSLNESQCIELVPLNQGPERRHNEGIKTEEIRDGSNLVSKRHMCWTRIKTSLFIRKRP